MQFLTALSFSAIYSCYTVSAFVLTLTLTFPMNGLGKNPAAHARRRVDERSRVSPVKGARRLNPHQAYLTLPPIASPRPDHRTLYRFRGPIQRSAPFHGPQVREGRIQWRFDSSF